MTSIKQPISEFRASFWRRTIPKHPKPVSLDSAAKTLSKKFPYIKLQELVRIDRLKIVIDPYFPNLPGAQDCLFFISHSGIRENGFVLFTDSHENKEIICNSLQPNLPKRNEGAAATLFTLMLTRGNSFEKVRLFDTNKLSLTMATEKMTMFSPVVLKDQGPNSDHTDILLTPPKLTKAELNANECIWRFMLDLQIRKE